MRESLNNKTKQYNQKQNRLIMLKHNIPNIYSPYNIKRQKLKRNTMVKHTIIQSIFKKKSHENVSF